MKVFFFQTFIEDEIAGYLTNTSFKSSFKKEEKHTEKRDIEKKREEERISEKRGNKEGKIFDKWNFELKRKTLRKHFIKRYNFLAIKKRKRRRESQTQTENKIVKSFRGTEALGIHFVAMRKKPFPSLSL